MPQDRDDRDPRIEVLDADNLHVDIAMDMPHSKGELTSARTGTAPDVRHEDAGIPGRVVDGRTARERAVAAGADVGQRAAEVAMAVEGGVDEVSDIEAMRLVARRQGVGAPVEGPVPEPRPVEPSTLPDVIRGTVFDPNSKHETRRREPEWLTVYDLPGYMQQGIRALGRAVFNIFPCFDTHSRKAREAGEDGLGSIRIMASISGGGPSPRSDLDTVASWIRKNGTPLQASALELPFTIPGYRPRVIVCADDETTFLMVDEKRTEGAPGDAMYIYAWTGGRAHYLGAPQDMRRLSDALAGTGRIVGPAPARRPAGGRQGAPAGRALPVAQAPGLEDAPVVPSRAPLTGERRRQVLDAVERAPGAVRSGLAVDLRRVGFLPEGPQSTPTLVRRDDGVVAVLIGQEGVPAMRTSSFALEIRDGDGEVLSRADGFETLDDIESSIRAFGQSPRP